MSGPDILAAPRYYIREAARLVGMKPDRVRRYLRGYSYLTPSASGEAQRHLLPPVTRPPSAADRRWVSFLDLIDLVLVRQLTELRPLQKVRKFMEEVRDVTGTTHVATQAFFTSGAEIYLRSGPGEILQLGTGGQTTILSAFMLEEVKIEFEESSGRAVRWFPNGKDGRIVLDPAVVFGQPRLVGHRLPTASIYDLYQAENDGVAPVADWFSIEPEEVLAAVNYHRSIAAAA